MPVEIGLWPVGFKIHPGEILQVTVAPYHSEAIPLALGAAPIDIPADRYTYDPACPPEMITLSGSRAVVPARVGEQSVKPDDRTRASTAFTSAANMTAICLFH